MFTAPLPDVFDSCFSESVGTHSSNLTNWKEELTYYSMYKYNNF